MRFVRVQADGEGAPAGLSELAAGGELDLVQLDYNRPRTAAAPGPGPVELPEFAPGFAPALRALQKSLYLEPQLCVAASAGWGSSYMCVESAAAVLREAGCRDLPISAVRGSNVLPILEDLQHGGVTLDNIETGAPWRELRAEPLAADLLLGAGPIVTALAEGARVVVAGSYDGAAPATAAAVREFGWEWHDWNCLAGAATAARAAAWSPWRLPTLSPHPRVELGARGECEVEMDQRRGPVDEAELFEWLERPSNRHGWQAHADVRCDASKVQVATAGPSQLGVAGAAGAKPDGQWQLEVLYQLGFVAEILVELLPESATVRSRIAAAFQSHFTGHEMPGVTSVIRELACQGVGEQAAGWLHLVCRSAKARECQRLIDQVAAFVGANPAAMRLPAGRREVLVECGVWPTAVPRGAVDVAVDTRPAREWE